MRFIGSRLESVVEERPETIDAQLRYLTAGNIHAVMLPRNSNYQPPAPDGMMEVVIEEGYPGDGRYIFDPARTSAEEIRSAVSRGSHGMFLGYLYPKQEWLGNGEKELAVTTRNVDGIVVQDAAIPSRVVAIMRQARHMRERFPGVDISVRLPQEALEERLR
jgi:hypothetical protein